MDQPVQITFRDVPPSAAVEARIQEEAEALRQYDDRIVRCRVVVEQPHRHHHQGRLFAVHIDLTVPGREIVIGPGSDDDHAHEDVYVAIRDAFEAARRQLQGHVRRLRERRHESAGPLAEGRVARLIRDGDYGFIETKDGREIYFHRNSVIDGSFDRIEAGVPVHFVEELGEKGPQATTVRPRHSRSARGKAAAE
ncbi:MAG: 30S ribosomal protein S30 [Polyangiaceae bacterium UTPRO1]|jgi:cold shock CspA family protein|nr:HPF/RaiA family ribosome-associated protein [Myxococcales bacterium]OQY68002.1 MAG: 30S ribosomal protein S30 [Polyangiaceae bacterium UTPRO1]